MKTDMIKNVVFMGTPDFAVGTLQALIDSDRYQVSAVFTQPDKPKGRGKTMQMTPVKETALAAGIPVYQPVRIRDDESYHILQELSPDAIIVVAFGQIIPQRILDLPEHGCINVHASLLPKYRGAAPIQWAVLNGEKESGVTTMRMDAGLDTGDMMKKVTVRLAEDETGGSLFDRLSEAGARLLIETLDAVNEGTDTYEKQPQESPTAYASMLTKEMGRIDWSKDAHTIDCLIRGLNPWPSAYTYCRGKMLKIWSAKAEPAPDGEALIPGTVAEVTKRTLKIQTGEGLLSVLEVQAEGKKRMLIDAFLRGYSMEAGELLGQEA
jgi:methionyl-tRNA formyltransferase